jgi:hypothetical protein
VFGSIATFILRLHYWKKYKRGKKEKGGRKQWKKKWASSILELDFEVSWYDKDFFPSVHGIDIISIYHKNKNIESQKIMQDVLQMSV